VDDADTRLHVGLPEEGLEQAYGSALAIRWAVIVGGSGVIMILVLLLLGAYDPGSWACLSVSPGKGIGSSSPEFTPCSHRAGG
jgi:hypothetical protein